MSELGRGFRGFGSYVRDVVLNGRVRLTIIELSNSDWGWEVGGGAARAYPLI